MRIHSAGSIISAMEEVIAISLDDADRELLRNMGTDITVFVVGPPGTSEEVLSRAAEAAKRGMVFNSDEERRTSVEAFFVWMRSEIKRRKQMAEQTKKATAGEHALAGALVAHGYHDEVRALEAALAEAERRGLVGP